MTVMPEDKKSAVQISITLSSLIMQAALAILSIEAAYVAYALTNRETSIWFGLSAIITAICFVVSIFKAGKAITQCRNDGFKGNWDISSGKDLFNQQAVYCLIGLIFLFFTFLLSGNPKETDLNSKFSNLENNYTEITNNLNNLKIDQKNINNSLKEIKREIKNNKESIEQLEIDVNNILLEQVENSTKNDNLGASQFCNNNYTK